MSGLGLLLIGIGVLTVWAGFDRTNIFDLLRAIVGAPVSQRDKYGALKSSTASA